MDSDGQVHAREDARHLRRWQARLLPIVVLVIGLLAIAFFATSFVQLRSLNQDIRFDDRDAIGAVLKQADAVAPTLTGEDAVAFVKWKTAVVLENEIVRLRYRQVNATLRVRTWTRQMGFTTGMMMAIVGAMFILSKLSESRTELGGEMQGVKATVATSSPGIVLAVLGTALMLVTLSANYTGSTSDAPVYLDPVGTRPPMSATAPPDAGPAFDPAQNGAENELFDPSAPAGKGDGNAQPARDPKRG